MEFKGFRHTASAYPPYCLLCLLATVKDRKKAPDALIFAGSGGQSTHSCLLQYSCWWPKWPWSHWKMFPCSWLVVCRCLSQCAAVKVQISWTLSALRVSHIVALASMPTSHRRSNKPVVRSANHFKVWISQRQCSIMFEKPIMLIDMKKTPFRATEGT